MRITQQSYYMRMNTSCARAGFLARGCYDNAYNKRWFQEVTVQSKIVVEMALKHVPRMKEEKMKSFIYIDVRIARENRVFNS